MNLQDKAGQRHYEKLVTVPEFCTCGARLPEDARFCHKCGKPQRRGRHRILGAAARSSCACHVRGASCGIGSSPARRSRGFHRVPDPLAVASRCSRPFSGSCFSGLPARYRLCFLWWRCSARVFSPCPYRRRTGFLVSLAGGIHMGWITGVFSFITAMILVTIMAVALTDQTFASVFQFPAWSAQQ